MHEQNKRDASILRDVVAEIKAKELQVPLQDILEIADRLDPAPKHPTNGEIVEFRRKDGVVQTGYAGKNKIYAQKLNGTTMNIYFADYEDIEIIRIIDDNKGIRIDPPEDWAKMYYYFTDQNPHKESSGIKTIIRSELEKDEK